MRYNKYKKRRGYRSRVVKMKFQSFFDIATEADSMQIISVNAGGSDVLKRLAPFFAAYKYYKLGSVSFKLIPASTLPVSPSGLSYEVDEPGVDPRDQLTPGMCRITNGEDVLENISGMSAENQHKLYNNMLLDPRWFKWMLQSGVKRFGKPRYWQIGQLHQDKWPGSVTNYPLIDTDTDFLGTGSARNTLKVGSGFIQKGDGSASANASSPYGLFQTGHRGVLGWMPTDSFQPVLTAGDGTLNYQAMLAAIPEVELFKILMPPAYKTKYYYRAFVTETVYFRDPVVCNINEYRPIDLFHRPSISPMVAPNTPVLEYSESDLDSYTGGNDGSD